MATETAEPATETKTEEAPLPNPVIRNFDDAKAIFKQQRQEVGLDKPPAPEPDSVPSEVEADNSGATKGADAATSEQPASVLPDDVLNPASKESPEEKSAIAEIEAMTLPKNAKPEKVAAFNDLKKRAIENLTKAEQKVKDLEDRISKSTSNSEIEKLNEKLKQAELKAAEIEDGWAKASLETSPQFQRQYIKREQAEIESAKAYLEGTEVDPRIVEYAARTHGASRVKVLTEAGLSPELIASVNSHLAVYDGIQRDKQTAIENWRAQGVQWQEQEAQRIAAEKQQRSEQENKVWENVFQKNSNLLPYRESKDEKWNSRRSELIERAKTIFNGNGTDLPTMAEVVQKGVAYDALQENVVTPLFERVKLLEQENARLKSAAPGGTITQPTGTVSKTDPSKVSREELSKSTFNDALAAARGQRIGG